MFFYLFFFFQAEDGIRDHCVTGVQTCALPILHSLLFLVQKKERVYISQHSSIFTPRPSRWNPPKRSSVLNVLEQVYYKERNMSSKAARQAGSLPMAARLVSPHMNAGVLRRDLDKG